MEIKVQTFCGKIVTIEIEDGEETVQNLKRKVEEKIGIPPDRQNLCYGGDSLRDNQKITEIENIDYDRPFQLMNKGTRKPTDYDECSPREEVRGSVEGKNRGRGNQGARLFRCILV